MYEAAIEARRAEERAAHKRTILAMLEAVREDPEACRAFVASLRAVLEAAEGAP